MFKNDRGRFTLLDDFDEFAPVYCDRVTIFEITVRGVRRTSSSVRTLGLGSLALAFKRALRGFSINVEHAKTAFPVHRRKRTLANGSPFYQYYCYYRDSTGSPYYAAYISRILSCIT